METNKDTYNTINAAVENILFKEKNSKFIGYAFPIQSENEVKPLLENLKNLHPQAGHFCYAYQLGTETIKYKTNDDGEPNNSAGQPIYGQILSFKLNQILVVVIRYFGGVKLGVGGLISAYKTTAQITLESAEIVEKTIDVHFKITFDYKNMNKVMRIIKEKNLNLINQQMETNCQIEISARKSQKEVVLSSFNQLFEVAIEVL